MSRKARQAQSVEESGSSNPIGRPPKSFFLLHNTRRRARGQIKRNSTAYFRTLRDSRHCARLCKGVPFCNEFKTQQNQALALCAGLLHYIRMRITFYARVTMDEQNLDFQLNALKDAGCVRIFDDKGVSGAATKRDGLDKYLAAIEAGDQLVTWRLDRLGRSLPYLIATIAKIEEVGGEFRALTEAIYTSTSGGKLIFQLMGHWRNSNVL